MPFGAQTASGSTSFRLWAPAASRVDLVLGDEARGQPIDRLGGGWYGTSVGAAGAGTRYAFRIDDRITVPDPASRANPEGVHAPSAVVDPRAYRWSDEAWGGRRWEEAVVYELHVGTFSPQGNFAGVAARLGYLVDLGVTAIELMPVAAFPGRRNWGYDGVLPFAPAAVYGTPEDFKQLVDAAHAHGLMVLLDVVYNHFGPEGNYLHAYAPQFFNPRHPTPWGAAINFDGEHSRIVRDFFLHNALYWLEEFHLDGLRLDAVHAIADDSQPHIVSEIAARVRERFEHERHVHLVLENDRNEARYLRRDAAGRPLQASAQWNDDLHHALHVIATGESDGYYTDYARDPVASLGRALAEGFVFQGDVSPYRGGARRGEPSADLPPIAFVPFAQNHDQVGNRALGERIGGLADAQTLRALMACVLLAPAPPLLFMGEEFAASTPFLFFCDFAGELAHAVTRGRRAEAARFTRRGDGAAQRAIPDPSAEATFAASKLDWREAAQAPGAAWLAFYRECLALRRRHVVPLLPAIAAGGTYEAVAGRPLHVAWNAGGHARLHLVANLSPRIAPAISLPQGERVFASTPGLAPGERIDMLPWSVAFIVELA
jgi:malto-oligosyltrehalose trehalohydrolase